MLEELEKELKNIKEKNKILEEIVNEDLDKKIYYSMKININKIIDENRKIRKKCGRLEKENKKLESRYLALSKSKLGRLTIRYWGLRDKYKGNK